jgi:hypothetical protein
VPVDQPTEWWIADDGTGYSRSAAGVTAFQNMEVAGMAVSAVEALPTDPAALRAALLALPEQVVDGHMNPASDGLKVATESAQLLASAVTPVPVKQALFALLRDVPDATLVPTVTDPQGRTGVGIRFGQTWQSLFVFDPDSGQVLADHVTGPGTDAWTVNLESTRTDSAPH